HARHAGDDVELSPLDVDLDEVGIERHQIVERRHAHRLGAGHLRIHAVGIEAVDGAEIAADVQVAHVLGAPGGDRVDGDVGEAVARDVLAQDREVVRRRLDGDDVPGGTDEAGGIDGVVADVRADVDRATSRL